MKSYYSSIVFWVLLIMIVGGCGGEKETPAEGLQNYLPAQLGEAGFIRVSEVRTFAGSALWEYINGQAELYHQYNFVDVATTNYKAGDIEFETDIYRFSTPDDSYGLYSMFRNPEDDIIDMGVEGFVSPGRIMFTKGVYLVKVTGFDESEDSNRLMVELAEVFDNSLSGKETKPAAFDRFPADEIVAATDKYYAQSFMGQKFLNRVYAKGYVTVNDTITLFMTVDSLGDKYAQWQTLADNTGRKEDAPAEMSFDENYYFIYNDPFHGKIIVGLKSKMLVGLVNFSERSKYYLIAWLETL